ncbi:unnamed protein product [Mortierella alpina]
MFCTLSVMCEDAGGAGTREVAHCVCTHFISEDFKTGLEPGASQSQGSAAARILRTVVDLDDILKKLGEASDVRTDLVAVEAAVMACRRYFIDGMDALPTLPLAYPCRAKTLHILLARGMDWHSLPFLASAHNVVMDEMFSDTLQTVAITSDTFDACVDTIKGNALNCVRALWKRIGGNDDELFNRRSPKKSSAPPKQNGMVSTYPLQLSMPPISRSLTEDLNGHDIDPDALLHELTIINIEDISRTLLAVAVDVIEKGTGDFWERLRSALCARDIHNHYQFTEEECCDYLTDEESWNSLSSFSFELEKRVPAEGKKAGVKGAATIAAIAMAITGATLM